MRLRISSPDAPLSRHAEIYSHMAAVGELLNARGLDDFDGIMAVFLNLLSLVHVSTNSPETDDSFTLFADEMLTKAVIEHRQSKRAKS